MADWQESGGPVETAPVGGPGQADPIPSASASSAPGRARPASSSRDRFAAVIDALGDYSIGRLLGIWLVMTVSFGVVYWAWSAANGRGLRIGAVPMAPTLRDLATAIYFSFVTALSIGYGDVTPEGALRVLAITEGAAGLLLFGCVISKLVSRRQEALTGEIHRLAFEDRLGRVRTNLHLVLSDLQAIAGMCEEPTARPERVIARLESTATIFAGEVQTIHDLLFRPQQIPDERVLESILANLAGGLREMSELLQCRPVAQTRSAALQGTLRSLAELANEICGECVPREYAPAMKAWMNRIQELSRKLA
jgi:potassium channel LctB